MTRRNSLQTIHEPFGDAFYYGPERIGSRFEDDEKTREESGYADSTFKTILDRIESEAAEVCPFSTWSRLQSLPPIGFCIALSRLVVGMQLSLSLATLSLFLLKMLRSQYRLSEKTAGSHVFCPYLAIFSARISRNIS